MQLKLKLEMVEFLVNALYGFREKCEFGVFFLIVMWNSHGCA